MVFTSQYGKGDKLDPQALYLGLYLSTAAYKEQSAVSDNDITWLGAQWYVRDALGGEVPSHMSMMRHPEGLSVAIEGTQNIRDWFKNAAWSLLVGLPTAQGRTVAVYWQVAQQALTQILLNVTADTPIFLTGHSRGGAVAVVLAHELRARGFNVSQVITFGAPKVGNKTFSDAYTPLTINVKAYQDPVQYLPPGNTRLWSPAGNLLGMVGDLLSVGTDIGIGPPEGAIERARRTVAYAAYISGLNPSFVSAHSLANYIRTISGFFNAERDPLLATLFRFMDPIARDWNFT